MHVSMIWNEFTCVTLYKRPSPSSNSLWWLITSSLSALLLPLSPPDPQCHSCRDWIGKSNRRVEYHILPQWFLWLVYAYWEYCIVIDISSDKPSNSKSTPSFGVIATKPGSLTSKLHKTLMIMLIQSDFGFRHLGSLHIWPAVTNSPKTRQRLLAIPSWWQSALWCTLSECELLWQPVCFQQHDAHKICVMRQSHLFTRCFYIGGTWNTKFVPSTITKHTPSHILARPCCCEEYLPNSSVNCSFTATLLFPTRCAKQSGYLEHW